MVSSHNVVPSDGTFNFAVQIDPTTTSATYETGVSPKVDVSANDYTEVLTEAAEYAVLYNATIDCDEVVMTLNVSHTAAIEDGPMIMQPAATRQVLELTDATEDQYETI